MKKTILFTLMLVVSICVKATDVKLIGGSLSVFQEQENAFLEIDYSNTIVQKQTLDEYLQSRGADYVRDWPNDKEKALQYFVVQFNKKNKKGLQVVTTPGVECKYKMVLHVSYLDMGNGGSMFIPMASMKAGGVIMNGVLDMGEMNTGKAVCRIEAQEIKGMGHVSETVRLGMCYFEFAQRVFKEAKKNTSTLPISDSDVDLMMGRKAKAAKTAPKKVETVVEEPAPVETKPAAKATASNAKQSAKKTPAKTSTPAKTATATRAASSKTASTKTTSAAGSDTPSAAVLKAEWVGEVNNRGEGGDASCLAGQETVSLYMDFSQATFDGRSESELISYMMSTDKSADYDEYFDNTWKYYKSLACSKFLNGVNEQLDDIRLVRRQGQPYTLKVVIREVDSDGSIKADYLITRTSTGKVEAAYFLICDGGRNGSFTDLMLTGIRNAAKDVGKAINKAL